MYRFIVFRIFVCVFSSASCQEYKESIATNQIKISLDRLARTTSGIQLNYQHLWKNNFATGVAFGHIISKSPLLLDTVFSNFSGKLFAIDQKYFFYHNQNTHLYIAGEYHFIKSRYQAILEFVDETKSGGQWSIFSTSNDYLDTTSIARTAQSFNFLLGVQSGLGCVVFEFNFGIGIKYCDVKHSDRIRPQDALKSALNPEYISSLKQEGSYPRLGLPFNFTVGFTF